MRREREAILDLFSRGLLQIEAVAPDPESTGRMTARLIPDVAAMKEKRWSHDVVEATLSFDPQHPARTGILLVDRSHGPQIQRLEAGYTTGHSAIPTSIRSYGYFPWMKKENIVTLDGPITEDEVSYEDFEQKVAEVLALYESARDKQEITVTNTFSVKKK